MATEPTASLGVPITMPTDRKIIPKPVSAVNLKQLTAASSSIPASPRPANRPLKGNHAQVVLLKRKRHEEPLDGLLLEMSSKNFSDLDLSKQTADNSADEEGGDEEDAKAKASIRARKRKKLASARGFFQLAETVEKAKWDDEAWRRDFNERVLTKTKEGKKALAAAAGVEVALDSPVLEKTQPIHPPSPARPASSPAKPQRKYTAVLQVRPKPEELTSQPREKGKEKEKADKRKPASIAKLPTDASVADLKKESSTANLKSSSTTNLKKTSAANLNKASTTDLKKETLASGSKAEDAESVVYFNAVPILSAYPGEMTAQEEDDEIAAFLPMLQDYLRINDIAPAKILPEKKKEKETKGTQKDQLGVHNRQESVASQSASDDEYVYDVYFKGNTEPTSSDWNNLGNYGTLVGLPPESKGDDDDSDAGEDDSDYEEDDDSNAEEFYRNDYPDEEEDYSDSENSDEYYNDRDDSEEEEDYDDDTRWR